MMCAEKTFISSTFLSEAVGPAAAIETIKLLKRNKNLPKTEVIKIKTMSGCSAIK